MRITLLIPTLLLASTFASSQVKHWTETSNELIWRGRYKNCDHGYLVNLPPGVVGHGSHPPSPNHGILISADNPSITTEVTLEERRLVDVYDSNDATDLGSARAYLKEYELKPANASEKITILEQRDTKFRGFSAVYVHFRKTKEVSTSEVEELVVYRTPKEIGPLFNIVLLRTTPEFYSHDHALFLQVRDGLQFSPVPRGDCSND
ncbi:MAG TPA: hypothetical protein VEG64_04465 [Candidatus Sulfotelmatobacter sp.]|nr:hypothetical protein [Candidatus Sulfotelmatobacter sp.]